MAQNDTTFNPSPQTNAPEDFGYSRGAQAPEAQRYSNIHVDQSYIGMAGQAGIDAFVANDTAIKKDIENTSYQTAQNVFNKDIQGLVAGDNPPPELQSASKDFDKMGAAIQGGGQNKEALLAQAYKMVKDLKSDYGVGYYRYIDEMATSAFGTHTIASRLDTALRQAQAAGAEKGSKDEQFLRSNGAELSVAYGQNWYQRIKAGEVPMDRAIADVGNLKAMKLAKENALTDLSLRKDVQEQAADAFNTFNHADSAFRRRAGMPQNVDQNAIFDLANKARDTADAKTDKQLVMAISQYRQNEMQILLTELNSPSPVTGKSWRDVMGDENAKRIVANKQEELKMIEDYAVNKNFGALTAMITANDATIDKSAAMAESKDKYVQAYKVLQKIDPELAKAIPLQMGPSILDAKDLDSYKKHMSIGNVMGILGGEKESFGEVATDKNGDPNWTYRETMKALSAGPDKINDSAFANGMEATVDPGSKRFFSNVNPNESKDPSKNEGLNRQKVLSMALNLPNVQRYYDLSAGKGDTARWEDFKERASDLVATNAREDVANVQEMMTTTGSPVKVTWDPKTHMLVTNEAELSASERQRWGAGLKGIKALNLDLQQVSSLWHAEGQGDDSIAYNMYDYLTNEGRLGIDPGAKAPSWAEVFHVDEGQAQKPMGERGSKTDLAPPMHAGLGDLPGNAANDNPDKNVPKTFEAVSGGKEIVEQRTDETFEHIRSGYGKAGQKYIDDREDAYRKTLQQIEQAKYMVQTSNSPSEKIMALHEMDAARALANRIEMKAMQADAEEKMANDPQTKRLQEAKKLLERRGLTVIPGGLDKMLGGMGPGTKAEEPERFLGGPKPFKDSGRNYLELSKPTDNSTEVGLRPAKPGENNDNMWGMLKRPDGTELHYPVPKNWEQAMPGGREEGDFGKAMSGVVRNREEADGFRAYLKQRIEDVKDLPDNKKYLEKQLKDFEDNIPKEVPKS